MRVVVKEELTDASGNTELIGDLIFTDQQSRISCEVADVEILPLLRDLCGNSLRATVMNAKSFDVWLPELDIRLNLTSVEHQWRVLMIDGRDGGSEIELGSIERPLEEAISGLGDAILWIKDRNLPFPIDDEYSWIHTLALGIAFQRDDRMGRSNT